MPGFSRLRLTFSVVMAHINDEMGWRQNTLDGDAVCNLHECRADVTAYTLMLIYSNNYHRPVDAVLRCCIDHFSGRVLRSVGWVRVRVCLSVCLCFRTLTDETIVDFDFWHVGLPWLHPVGLSIGHFRRQRSYPTSGSLSGFRAK